MDGGLRMASEMQSYAYSQIWASYYEQIWLHSFMNTYMNGINVSCTCIVKYVAICSSYIAHDIIKV